MSTQPIGTAIILLNSKNQILLGKRKNGYKPGTFGLPGGRIEVWEAIAKAASRELQEETEVTAKKLENIGIVKETQEHYDFIHFGFVCKQWKGEINNCEPEKCEG